jgi:hypothetical protein
MGMLRGGAGSRRIHQEDLAAVAVSHDREPLSKRKGGQIALPAFRSRLFPTGYVDCSLSS